MEKRFVIFIIFSAVILYLSNYWLMDKAKKVTPTEKQIEYTKEEAIKEKPSAITQLQPPAQLQKEPEKHSIENDFVNIETSSLGAKIVKILIKKIDEVKDLGGKIDLIEQLEEKNNLNLIINLNKQKFNLKDATWNVEKSERAINSKIEPIKNIVITKSVIMGNDFSGKIVLKIENNTNENLECPKTAIEWGPALNLNKNQYNSIKQVVVLNNNRIKRINSKKKDETTILPVDNGWIGMRDNYFCAIFYGPAKSLKEVEVYQKRDQTLGFAMIFPPKTIPTKRQNTFELNFYFGPQNYNLLSKKESSISQIIDFGMFKIISLPIYHLLRFFYQVTKNYGIAIILLTVLIRIILWWPTQKSYSSMKKMQTGMNKMQPRLKTLKEVYKDNPQKLNEETMKLYKEYQINPMGGCLPMLLQMPIFFALYSTLNSAVELKGASFVWFWTDLSAKDPYYVLPILMGLSMFIQQKISTPPAATPEAATQQKMMLYFMPVMLTFFSFLWPSGLLLYWVISNILSIGQQILINRKV